MNRTTKTFLTIASVTSLLVGCSPNSSSSTAEAEFLQAFLQAQFSSRIANGVELVVSSKPKIYGPFQCEDLAIGGFHISEESPFGAKEIGEAIEDYCSRNRVSGDFSTFFESWEAVTIISPEEYEELTQTEEKFAPNEFWKRFYEKYPGAIGHIELSHPGFSANGQLGIVFLSLSQGSLAGHAAVYVMEKRRGVWVESKTRYSIHVTS